MSSKHLLTIVGVGAARRAALTLATLETMQTAPRLHLHPAASAFIADLRARGDLPLQQEVITLPDLQIATALMALTERESVVYVMPGHPLREGTALLAALHNLTPSLHHAVEVRIVATTLDLTAVGRDPLAALHLLDATGFIADHGDAARGLAARWSGATPRLLNAQVPLLLSGVRAASAAAVAARLMERYPATQEVIVVQGDEGVVRWLTLAALATPLGGDPLLLYVPPLAPLDDTRAPATLGYITARLRAPAGCPWDREQSHASLTPYLIEEAYEAVEAIERNDAVDMVEELGDVLLQVVLHSQLAEEEGRFTLADVASEVNRKLVRRHPHVFGDVEVGGPSDVLRNWEAIKRAEKGERRRSALDGVPSALPALMLAEAIGRKAAKVGFDWRDVEGTYEKVREEIAEVRAAATPDERREEMGDLLFALSAACRHLGIDAEGALRAATHKFAARFRRVETYARERGLDLSALDLEALDVLWREAKMHDGSGA